MQRLSSSSKEWYREGISRGRNISWSSQEGFVALVFASGTNNIFETRMTVMNVLPDDCSPGSKDKWRSRIYKNLKQGETTKTKITWGMKKVITNGLWDRKWLLIHESKIQRKIKRYKHTNDYPSNYYFSRLNSIDFSPFFFFPDLFSYCLLGSCFSLLLSLLLSLLGVFVGWLFRKDFSEMTYDPQMTSSKKKERKREGFDTKTYRTWFWFSRAFETVGNHQMHPGCCLVKNKRDGAKRTEQREEDTEGLRNIYSQIR